MKERAMQHGTKKEIEGRADIELLVDRFYDKVVQDPLLGPIFNDVAAVDWDEHLPKMYDFWCSILFGEGSYKGDPMSKHVHLSQKTPMKREHFERWLDLFEEPLEETFQGAMPAQALERARSIAGIMQYKIGMEEAN